MSKTQMKQGDRVKIDVRREAYYQKRGISVLLGSFVEYKDQHGAYVLVDGQDADEYRDLRDIEPIR